MSFEVTIVTSMDSQEPLVVMMATCWLLNEVGANMQLTLYKARFPKFDRGWDYKCIADAPSSAHKLLVQST